MVMFFVVLLLGLNGSEAFQTAFYTLPGPKETSMASAILLGEYHRLTELRELPPPEPAQRETDRVLGPVHCGRKLAKADYELLPIQRS